MNDAGVSTIKETTKRTVSMTVVEAVDGAPAGKDKQKLHTLRGSLDDKPSLSVWMCVADETSHKHNASANTRTREHCRARDPSAGLIAPPCMRRSVAVGTVVFKRAS